ncbi:hypothetical protein ABK040_014516 [Willaertia magna]
MSIVNVPKNVLDEHYRYRREILQLKIEGQGNGKKTVILNLENISNQLGVPSQYIIKHFGLELAASARVKDDKTIINGEYDINRVETALENFITKIVLCPKCQKPELDFKVKSNKAPITSCCRACHFTGQIDSSEKLYNTMVKFPPKSTKGFKSVTVAPSSPVLDKKEDANNNKDNNKKVTASTTNTPTGQISNEKAVIDDGSWSLDTSQEAIRKRREMEGLSEKFLELTKGVDEEDEEEEEIISPVTILKQFIELKENATHTQLYQVITKLKTDYNLGDSDCICLLFEVFLLPSNDIIKEMKEKAPLFKRFLSSKGQKIILCYIEELAGMKDVKLLPKVSIILYEFYRNGLLTKEVFEDWFSKKKSRVLKDNSIVVKVKEASKPFCQWLLTQ